MSELQNKIDDILSNLGVSNVPNTNGQLSEVDPVSIAYVRKELLKLMGEQEPQTK